MAAFLHHTRGFWLGLDGVEGTPGGRKLLPSMEVSLEFWYLSRLEGFALQEEGGQRGFFSRKGWAHVLHMASLGH